VLPVGQARIVVKNFTSRNHLAAEGALSYTAPEIQIEPLSFEHVQNGKICRDFVTDARGFDLDEKRTGSHRERVSTLRNRPTLCVL